MRSSPPASRTTSSPRRTSRPLSCPPRHCRSRSACTSSATRRSRRPPSSPSSSAPRRPPPRSSSPPSLSCSTLLPRTPGPSSTSSSPLRSPSRHPPPRPPLCVTPRRHALPPRNSVIRALVVGGRVVDALVVFIEMKSAGIEPDVFTYRVDMDGCCKSFRMEMDDAFRVFQEMQGSGGVRADVVVYNLLLDGLFKAKKLDEACGFFETMVADGIQCSASTHNTVIDGLFKNGRAEAACRLFYELRRKGQLLDGIAYSIMAREFCKEGKGDHVAEAVELVKEMDEQGFVVDLVTVTTLLIGFNKSRRWDLEEQILKFIRDSSALPDAIRWKSNMMTALRRP